MRLLKTQLPSGGFNCLVDYIDIKPLTYNEVLRFNNKNANKDNVGTAIYDIENLIIDRIPEWKKLCYYDFPFICCMTKLLTMSETKRYTINGFEFGLEDITFTTFPDELGEISQALNKPFRIPSLEVAYNHLKLSPSESNLELALVACCLSMRTEDLENADVNYINDIEKLRNIILSQPVLKGVEGGEEALRFRASDLFLYTCANRSASTIKSRSGEGL